MDKTFKWAAAALACGLAAGAAAIPWRIASPAPALRLAEAAQAAFGAQAEAATAPKLRLLPIPQIEFADVRARRPDGGFELRVPRLVARLRLAALLSGRFEFAHLRLVEPSLAAQTAALGDVASALRGLALLAQSPASAPDAITLTRGEISLRGENGATRALRDVNLAFEWRGDASAVGSFMHAGERFTVEGLLSRPATTLRGEDSPFTLKIASDVLNLSLNGAVAGGARWLVEARLASASERLRSLLAIIDARPFAPTRMQRFALSGQIRALPQTMSLADVKLTLDQNPFEGSLTLRTGDERPRLSGTLAARTLDLSSADLGWNALFGADGGWSRERLPAAALNGFDADLRISAARASFGRFVMSDAGLLIKIDAGALDAVLADSQAYGGKLRGRFALREADGLDMRMAATFSGVETASLLRDLSGKARISGAANGEISLSAFGQTPAALMQSASGALRVSLARGELAGVDIEQAVRRAERRPLSIAADMRSGQTKFTSAEFDANLTRGALRLQQAQIVGHGMEMIIAGEASAPERTLRLSVAAAPPRAGAQNREPVLFLDVAGSWDEPSLSVDADRLIRRSRAAAPLLPPERVREDETAREAEAAPEDARPDAGEQR